MHRIVVATTLLAILGAGCGGGSADGASAAGGTLAVTGTDALAFEPSSLTAPPGEVTVELTAEPGVGHSVVVEGVDGDAPVVEVDAGGTGTGTVELAAGSYTVYCSVPGHRDAGMETSLDVAA